MSTLNDYNSFRKYLLNVIRTGAILLIISSRRADLERTTYFENETEKSTEDVLGVLEFDAYVEGLDPSKVF